MRSQMEEQMQRQSEEERSFYYNRQYSAQRPDDTRGRYDPYEAYGPGPYDSGDPYGPYDAGGPYDQYGPDDYPEESPDDLADDMPFSHLLKKR